MTDFFCPVSVPTPTKENARLDRISSGGNTEEEEEEEFGK